MMMWSWYKSMAQTWTLLVELLRLNPLMMQIRLRSASISKWTGRVFVEKLVARDTASGRHKSSSKSRGLEEHGTDSDCPDDDPPRLNRD